MASLAFLATIAPNDELRAVCEAASSKLTSRLSIEDEVYQTLANEVLSIELSDESSQSLFVSSLWALGELLARATNNKGNIKRRHKFDMSVKPTKPL